jgi:hypothetical protein
VIRKKARGLSLLQKRIMLVAARVWITPAEAVQCVWYGADDEVVSGNKNSDAIYAASASRAVPQCLAALVRERAYKCS